MVESRDTDRQVDKHEPVLINRGAWVVFPAPDLLVVRCVRHFKGPKTDEVLGAFDWDEWDESEKLWTTEVARIVKEIIPDAHWHDYAGLSTLYSKAMEIMVNDASIPFTYVMTFQGSWLTKVHHATI